jgi:hypothetical protein
VPQRADDQDPLLEFANEPEPVEPIAADEDASTQSAADVDIAPPASGDGASAETRASAHARLEKLEQSVQQTAGSVAALHTQLATLVAEIEDIKKRETRRLIDARLPRTPMPPVSRARTTPALAGVIAGVAIGLFVWTTWQRDSMPVIDAAPAAAATELPMKEVAPAPMPPAIALASTKPAARSRPIQETPDLVRDEAAAYVGTLSIDAAPGGEVFINRKAAGKTPLRVTNLKAGSHLVWIERDGYRRFTRVVHVPADRVSRLWADLELIATP